MALNCAPGGIGVLELELPDSFDASLLQRDGRIGVWRSIDGRPPYLDNGAIFLIGLVRYTSGALLVRAWHASSLLLRRIIAYNAGTAYTSKTGAADNLIKAFWAENAGASIVSADRDGVETQADISAYVSVAANLSQGASVSKACTRRNLGAVTQELCEASTTAGTYLTAEIYAPSESTLELRTYATARGVDHRAGSSQPIILSEARGNLEQAELTIDYSGEATMVIAGGQGEQEARLIATSLDTTRMGLSPFGRIEDFLDMSNTDTSAALQDEADAGLRSARPVITLTGKLIETPATTRGLHFDLGDLLTAEHPTTRQQFDVRLDVVHETIDQSGRSVDVVLRSVT